MQEIKTITTTIVLVKNQDRILLGRKKRGFALGKYIGIGGKQEPNEDIDVTMVRETQEEIGITPTKYEKVGILKFNTFYKGEKNILIMHIYICTEYSGEITETEEIEPKWFSLDEIPYNDMLEDDIIWMELVLKGEYILGTVDFNRDFVMQKNTIRAVSKSEILNNKF